MFHEVFSLYKKKDGGVSLQSSEEVNRILVGRLLLIGKIIVSSQKIVSHMDKILHYFPHLSPEQVEQYKALGALYTDWNEKINVISRKDIQNLYMHHILHSMSIGKVLPFTKGTTLLDVGTGGGFPTIPLAILFPECHFTAIDSIGKKIKVLSDIAEQICLKNVTAKHLRVQEEKGKFDFVISRAVMPLSELVKLSRKNVSKEHKNALPNGLICLKGGELAGELHPYRHIATQYELSEFFSEEFFTTKSAIYMPL